MIKDPIDLLKFEHAILKVRFRIILDFLNYCEEASFRIFEETHNFIVRWHAMIEDKYVFPAYGDKAKPLSNDHLLIEKYGNSIIEQKRKDWLERYVNIVLDHNRNEEEQLFIEKRFLDNSWSEIIKEYVKYSDNYLKITGLKLI